MSGGGRSKRVRGAPQAEGGGKGLHGAGGEDDRVDQARMTVGEAYGQRPAERMPDRDDLRELQLADQFGNGVCEGVQGVPARRRLGTAEARQIEGDDPAVLGQSGMFSVQCCQRPPRPCTSTNTSLSGPGWP